VLRRGGNNALTIFFFHIVTDLFSIVFPEAFRYNFTCSWHSKIDISTKAILSAPPMHEDIIEEVWTVAADTWR